jgi:hypothetical protein
MFKYIFILILSLLLLESTQAQKEDKAVIIEKMDALMGMHDVCVSPRFENTFICRFILDKNRNCQAVKAIGKLASYHKDSLELEGFSFAEKELHHEMLATNKKKNCTSLSCKKYHSRKSVSYSCPLLSITGNQALIFVHYYRGKQCRTAELYHFIKKDGSWKIIEKIKYFAS